MIVNFNGKDELGIFFEFKINKLLPKHRTEENNSNYISLNGIDEGWGNSIPLMEQNEPRYYWYKIAEFFKKIFKKQNKPSITILEFFEKFKDIENYDDVSKLQNNAEHIEQALISAKENGQKTLFEKLTKLLDTVRTESHLIQMRLKKVVTEEQIIDFYKQTNKDKNLKLTWIDNFVGVIPPRNS